MFSNISTNKTRALAMATLCINVAIPSFSYAESIPSDMYYVTGLGINYADGSTEFQRNQPFSYEHEYGAGVNIEGGIGYHFSRYFRADVRAGYMASHYNIVDERYNGAPTGITYLGNYNFTHIGTVMGNVFIDYPFTLTTHKHDGKGGMMEVKDDNLWGWYGGGGVGAYLSDENIGGAWQLMTGLTFRATPQMVVDAGYRYFSVATPIEQRNLRYTDPVSGAVVQPRYEVDLDASIFETGVRWTF